MALPVTREETAAPAALVKSATMNAVQDAIIGLHDRVRGVNTRFIAPSEMEGHNAVWTFLGGFGGSNLVRGWHFNDASPSALKPLIVPVPLLVGARVTAAKIYVYQGTATIGSISAVLVKQALATSGTVAGAFSAQSATVATLAATGYQRIDLTGITPEAIALGDVWEIDVFPVTASVDLWVLGAELTFDHPL